MAPKPIQRCVFKVSSGYAGHSKVNARGMLTGMRHDLKFQLRDAVRASGRRAGDIAVQSGVSRQQLADLLRGRDGVTLYVITAVCDRLGLKIELRAGVEPVYAPGVVRTLIDDVRSRLQH